MRVRPYLLLATALATACGQKGPLRLPGPRPATAVTAPVKPGPEAPSASGAEPAADAQHPQPAEQPDVTPAR